MDGQRNVLAALTPGKIAGTHCTQGRSGRVRTGKNLLPPPGLESRIVQPAVSRYPGSFTAVVKDTGEVFPVRDTEVNGGLEVWIHIFFI